MTTIRRLATTLAGIAFALFYLAPSVLAQRPPEDGPLPPPPPPTSPAHYGSPIWQFALVAAAAVVVTLLSSLAVNALRRHEWPGSSIAHA
jgi:hypothetical protein